MPCGHTRSSWTEGCAAASTRNRCPWGKIIQQVSRCESRCPCPLTGQAGGQRGEPGPASGCEWGGSYRRRLVGHFFVICLVLSGLKVPLSVSVFFKSSVYPSAVNARCGQQRHCPAVIPAVVKGSVLEWIIYKTRIRTGPYRGLFCQV